MRCQMKRTDNACVGYRFAAKFKGCQRRRRRTHFSLSKRDSSGQKLSLTSTRTQTRTLSVCLWPAPEHFSKLKRAINRRFWPGQLQQQQYKQQQQSKSFADRLLIIWIIKLSIPLLMMPMPNEEEAAAAVATEEGSTRQRGRVRGRGRGRRGELSEDQFNLALIAPPTTHERTIRLSLTVRKLGGKPCSICMSSAWGIGSSSSRSSRKRGWWGVNLKFS